MPTPLRLLVALAPASLAAAQVNGNFETGSLEPWTITPTQFGTALVSGVTLYDIDGPGPLPTSRAAYFLVGQTAPNTGLQGISLTQTEILHWSFTFSCQWSAHAVVPSTGSAGTF